MKRMTWRVATKLAASCIPVFFGSNAQALFIPATFDPPSNFVTPGFNGSALFNIASGCLAAGPGFHATADCGASTLDSATVFLYQPPNDVVRTPGSADGSFSFGPNAGEPVLGVLMGAGGVLLGVDTDPLGPKFVGAPFNDNFWLQFVSDACPPDVCAPIPPGCSSCFGLTALRDTDPAFIYQTSVTLANQSLPATVVFGAPLPEPGMLALLLSAIGLGSLARRFRARAR